MNKKKRLTVDETCELLEKELEKAGLPGDRVSESIKVGMLTQIASQLERIADLMEQQAR